MQILNRPAFLAFLIFAFIGTAAAQSSEEDLLLAYGDKSNISIATGSSQPITRAPSAATVITSRDIEAMGATDLDQVLESVPGVHVSMQHVAMNPIYSFRGIYTKENPQVLMLVNGIPITNVFWGDRSQVWGGMPLENVARIEVIRGPGSALYGADAFSGVINVITKDANDVHGTEYGLRAGSFNSRDAWIQHGGKLGTLDAAFYLRAGNTDGSQAILQKDAIGVSGPLSTARKAIDARADLSKGAWRFRAAYQKREIGIGAGLGGALDPNSRGQASRLYLDLNYDQANWAKNWDVSGVASYYNIREHGNPAYTLVPAGVIPAFPNGMIGNPGHSEQHPHSSISAFYTGFENHRVRIGTGFEVADLYATTSQQNFTATFAPNGVPPVMMDVTGNPAVIYEMPHKRTVKYAFAQDEWSLAKDWALTAGVRHDSYSDFGGTTNPRFALVWDAAWNVVVKAMHGTAFRAPSFSELYSINNPVTVGNPNIKPETITTDELAFSWQQTAKLKSNLNLFHYRMRNIILPVAATANYQNAGGQTGRGLEWEEIFDATGSLRLTGNYSWQHSIDNASGQDAGMAPHRHLFARSDWRFAPLWQLGATVNYVAGRMREPGDTRPLIPDYTTVGLTLRREKFADNWDARASVTNLFNSNALEPTFKSAGMYSDLPLPGRALYFQIQHKL
ncbi:MAG: TonB-dependent receptor [Burkholderiales bacterium]|nr:TonB-dependent receptor [Burkholderiales bacterium]